MRTFSVLLVLLLALPAASAGPSLPSSGPVHVKALAVEETPTGYVGTAADVEVDVLGGGTGTVYLSTKPLAQTDFQGSARLAAQVAGYTLGVDWTQQDYLVSFSSGSTIIGGPSAGAVMTLALTTALHNLLHPTDPWTLDPTVAATGTINPDGTIGPVGGVPAKAEGAQAAGIKTFLYPAGLDKATTQQSDGHGGARTVQVDMQSHCAQLGITCRSASTLTELVEAAAHVHIDTPVVDVPSTTDYASLLGPSVNLQVAALSSRIDRIQQDAQYRSLTTQPKQQVDTEMQGAQDELQKAQDALAQQRYYGSATEAFKGAIAAGRAENLTRFYVAPTTASKDTVVTAALDQCSSAAQRAQDAVFPLTPTRLDALFAIGAGQDRAQEASDLSAQAKSQHDGASSYSGWIDSLFSSTFCVERAKTATWWADLRTTFPSGPEISNLRDMAQASLDQAGDLVSYAQAVLQNTATEAQAKLDAALAHAQAGRLAAAIVDAADAQALASVAMQTGGESTVPPSVLAAAQQGAARAIDRARTGGAEPMLSVSLVELAQGQDQGPVSLQEYWSARNLALVDLAPSSHETVVTHLPTLADGTGSLAILAGGLILGLAASTLVVFGVRARRTR